MRQGEQCLTLWYQLFGPIKLNENKSANVSAGFVPLVHKVV